MLFTTDDARKIVAALGIQTDHLPAETLAQIAHDACRTDVLDSALRAFLLNKFALEIIRALSEAERAKLANRVAPHIVAVQQKRPPQWEVFIYSAEMKPAIRVLCPACRSTDGFFPLPDKVGAWGSAPMLEEQLKAAESFRFLHCGRKEEIPANVLAEFKRRIQPFCAGFSATAADYENARIQREIASTSSGTTTREDRIENPPLMPTLR